MDDKLYLAALKFLNFRPRSEKELRDYFKKKSYKIPIEQNTIEAIITKLKTQKFLNDEHFAKWWIEQRTITKPLGWRLIVQELKQKGIDKETIENAKLAIDNEDIQIGSEKERAITLAQQRAKHYKGLPKEKVYQRLGGFLARRGFGMEAIHGAIDEVLKNIV